MAKKDDLTDAPHYGYGSGSRDVPTPLPAPEAPAAPPIQEYPKVMYRQDSTDRVTVNSEAEEDALGEGWYETPTAADPKAKPSEPKATPRA